MTILIFPPHEKKIYHINSDYYCLLGRKAESSSFQTKWDVLCGTQQHLVVSYVPDLAHRSVLVFSRLIARLLSTS